MWETLLEMERFRYQAGETYQGAIALVLDLAKSLRAGQSSGGLGLGDELELSKEDFVVLCGYFEHQRRVLFEGCVAEPLQTITAFLPGSKWSCLLLRLVLQDAMSETPQIFPPF